MRIRNSDHWLWTPALLTLGASPWLLRRMAREFDERGGLRPATTGWMYATYAAHASLYAVALAQGGRTTPRGHGLARAAGGVLAGTGAGACVAGMARFSGAAQVSGTRSGPFVTSGVYRFTRNPQYTGYIMLLAGGALARRSPLGLALAAGAAGLFRWWVPVEERHLLRSHGRAYRDYLASAPRWVGYAPRPASPRPAATPTPR